MSSPQAAPAAAVSERTAAAVVPAVLPLSTIKFPSFYSPRAQRAKPSAIRSLYPLSIRPGMLSLFAGLPNPASFPINKISITTTTGDVLEFSEKEVTESMQYSASVGMPQLVSMWRTMVLEEHKPQYNNSDLVTMVGGGTQDLFCKFIDSYVGEGDIVFLDSFSYPGAIQHFGSVGAVMIGVESDGSDGMSVSHLEEQLIAAAARHQQQPQLHKAPKILYLVPVGSNPTGFTIPTANRIKIYALAQQYNLLIMEDDPYYYLSFGAAAAPVVDADFVRPAPELSFLHLDTDGRVARFDSVSKIMSAGMRIGFVTGCTGIIHPIAMNQSGTNLFASGPAQVMVYRILSHLGNSGLQQHINSVALFYARRRDLFYGYVQQHLIATGLVTTDRPIAGMFLWMKVAGIRDSYDLVLTHALGVNVLMTPGRGFSAVDGEHTAYVRASFSIIAESDMEEAVKRFAKLLVNEVPAYAAAEKLLYASIDEKQSQQQ